MALSISKRCSSSRPRRREASPAAGLSMAAALRSVSTAPSASPAAALASASLTRSSARGAAAAFFVVLLRVLLVLSCAQAGRDRSANERSQAQRFMERPPRFCWTASSWRDARRETGRGQACHHHGRAHPFPRLPPVRGDVRHRHRDGQAGRIASIRGDKDDPFSPATSARRRWPSRTSTRTRTACGARCGARPAASRRWRSRRRWRRPRSGCTRSSAPTAGTRWPPTSGNPTVHNHGALVFAQILLRRLRHAQPLLGHLGGPAPAHAGLVPDVRAPAAACRCPTWTARSSS